MNEEMQSLEENETFSLFQLPPSKQAVGGTYALKSDTDGPEKYKARCVAKCYSHDKTFSPAAMVVLAKVSLNEHPLCC